MLSHLASATPGRSRLSPLGCCSALVGYDMAGGWGSLNMPNPANVAVDRLKAAARN